MEDEQQTVKRASEGASERLQNSRSATLPPAKSGEPTAALDWASKPKSAKAIPLFQGRRRQLSHCEQTLGDPPTESSKEDRRGFRAPVEETPSLHSSEECAWTRPTFCSVPREAAFSHLSDSEHLVAEDTTSSTNTSTTTATTTTRYEERLQQLLNYYYNY